MDVTRACQLYSVIDLNQRFTQADSLHSAWQLLLEELAQFGLSEGALAYGFRNKKNGFEINHYSNYSDEFLQQFEYVDGYNVDLVTQSIFEIPQTHLWDFEQHTKRQVLTSEEMALEHLSMDFEMDFGLSVPMQQSRWGLLTAVGFSATGIRRKEAYRDIYSQLSQILQRVALFQVTTDRFGFGDLLNPHSSCAPISSLNTREKSVLQWLASGMSIKQIADEKLYRSVESVNIHIRNAKHKLNATSRDQLIARAVMLGLI